MMGDPHTIPVLDAAGLRRFSFTVSAALVVVFGVFFPLVLGLDLTLWPWIVGALLSLWGLMAPATLAPVYQGWMRFGLLLNRVISPLVLGVVFFLVITPVALVMRVAGRDMMTRKLDPNATSYRVPSPPARRKQMERPF